MPRPLLFIYQEHSGSVKLELHAVGCGGWFACTFGGRAILGRRVGRVTLARHAADVARAPKATSCGLRLKPSMVIDDPGGYLRVRPRLRLRGERLYSRALLESRGI